MIELSTRWAESLRSQPETGMGYTVCTIRLTDGRTFERVIIVGGVITRCDGEKTIPFEEAAIAQITASHDKATLT